MLDYENAIHLGISGMIVNRTSVKLLQRLLDVTEGGCVSLP